MVRDPQKETLMKFTEKICEQYGFDNEAASHVEAFVLADPDQMARAAHIVALDAVSQIRHIARAVISAPPGSNGQSVKMYPRALQNSLAIANGEYYGWPLSDGTLLKDADRLKLVAEAAALEGKATGMLRRARFFRLVADKLHHVKKVGEVLSERQLRKLYDESARERGLCPVDSTD